MEIREGGSAREDIVSVVEFSPCDFRPICCTDRSREDRYVTTCIEDDGKRKGGRGKASNGIAGSVYRPQVIVIRVISCAVGYRVGVLSGIDCAESPGASSSVVVVDCEQGY